MKKILFIIFLFFAMLTQSAIASDMFKIKGLNIDTSASVIFLNTVGTYQSSITDNIKLVKLPSENKVYFDINSSILISKKQDLFFSQGYIKEIKISQFTTNPNIVRVVMMFNNGFDLDSLKIGNVDNNLVIMTNPLNEKHCQFYQNTYRDKQKASEDYYNILKLEMKSTAPVQSSDIKSVAQIQQAFNNSTAEDIVELVKSPLNENINLRSRYHINDIVVRNNGFKVNGFGAVTIQKPFFLTNPNRMVFDIANADFNENLLNKEITNPDGDTLRIAQFENNIVRIVITSNEAKQYIPIFSFDNQSLFLVNPLKLSTTTFAKNKANIVKYKYTKNLSTDDLTLTFDNPVIWGIKRNTDNLYIYFFNASQYNESVFKTEINNTPYGATELALLKNIGIRLTLPIALAEDVNTYFSADGKNFRIRTTGLKPIKSKEKKESPIIKNNNNKQATVVIDAGHGGTDYGAIRAGINEKDINLDVSKRVEAILTKRGYKVCMTRDTDVFLSLEERCQITNAVIPVLFVSIHVNSCVGTEPTGIETHYYHDNSIELANTIHNKMIQAIQTPNRGLFKSKFYVINHTTVPAVLLEIGFISNDRERAELVSVKRKQATAQAIAEGIIEYINKYNK